MSNIIDLQSERRRRRRHPDQHPDRLMAVAEILWLLRQDAEGALFLDASDVLDRLGPAFTAVIEVAADLTEKRRTS